MEKFVPFEKLSKKKQKELNAMKRGSWHGVNPVSRKSENPKAYHRQKARKWNDDVHDRAFSFASYTKRPAVHLDCRSFRFYKILG